MKTMPDVLTCFAQVQVVSEPCIDIHCLLFGIMLYFLPNYQKGLALHFCEKWMMKLGCTAQLSHKSGIIKFDPRGMSCVIVV